MRSRLIFIICLVAISQSAAAGTYKVYSTYLWHLQQPNYWPEKHSTLDRYTFAYEQLSGSPIYPGHPENNLADIFGKPDRQAVYQFRSRDAVAAINQPDGGAQISYSGCLIENISSLGNNFSLGYSPTWYQWIREGMGWQTTRGKRKLEPVGFTYHHALAPLIDKDALRKEIAISKDIWWKAWGGNPNYSDHPKGFRCAEETFSIRILKELVDAGYEWVIVPNHHLSRTHPNYVQLHGKGLYDPPNKADQINPPNAGTWYSGEIDGRGSTESVPFSFRAHRAKYVDPATGTEYKIIVVPMTDLGSYRDGFSQQSIGILDTLNAQATHDHPCIALFSHDGDNAWGGGFTYYQEAVPAFSGQAAGAGYRPTTIQTFLDENPPPLDDIVHVEDGSWFNAADDWGHPQFWNWLWYPQRDRNSPGYDFNDPSTYADITNGWAEDFRNWSVIVAAQNYVSTAEQIHLDGGGTVDDWRIQDPTVAGANDAELAWHFFLPALTSGYMYYGTAIDMEVKPTLACNQGVSYAKNIVDGNLNEDDTGPTVFIPQRYPYNPGTTNYGSAYGYRSWVAPSDFYVWTFAHDVSGLTSVVLRVRQDGDGVNPLSNNDNETYAGGASVGSWVDFDMVQREGHTFVSNIYNNPQIDFFIMPTVIADQYWYEVTGYSNQLLDYYVEAYDGRGNVKRTDIQHVFIGMEGVGSPPPGPSNVVPTVSFDPPAPSNCDDVRISYKPGTGPLAGATSVYIHVGVNAWEELWTPDPAMSWDGTNWNYVFSPVPETVQINCVFNDGVGVWDNNDGADWQLNVSGCGGGAVPSIVFAPGSPLVSADPGNPADQNNTGDSFDLNFSGGDAVTVDQGGFGSFGHVYFNYDQSNLYVGGIGCSVSGSNNAMIVFLGLDTLTDDAANLWPRDGAPQGLDHLHNLALDPPMDIAILLGDEYGDGNFASFNLGDGYDFGQGAFYLSANSFVPVAGTVLSQFDGASTNATGSADDDADRLMERWEVCLPWSSLNATSVFALSSCHVSGLIVNSSTNGQDRYISGNYLGSTATNATGLDGVNNYAFSFVTLFGLQVEIPDNDIDNDGLPNDWEVRFFGNATNGVPGVDDDGDGFTNDQEYQLGTDPKSFDSALRITGQSFTGDFPQVTWYSVGNKGYVVEWSTNLVDGAFTAITNVTEDDVPDGIGSTETFVHTSASNGWYFFRILLQ